MKPITKLLYHPPESGGTSPFDQAIVELSHGNPIKLASPYIGLEYLEGLIALSAGWELLSDVHAWLSSLNAKERLKAQDFIKSHQARIRHCDALHAKLVIGPSRAYLGSANLTNMGICGRTEMGVLLEDPAHVQEMHQWFDALWLRSSPPDLAQIEALVHHLNQKWGQGDPQWAETPPSSGGRQVRAKLVQMPARNARPGSPAKNAPAQPAEALLAKRIEDVVGELADSGFTLQLLAERLRQHRVPVSKRLAYLGLQPYCAALPRSVFSAGTVNRLLFDKGIFKQSSQQALLDDHLAPYDMYLAYVVLTLSFDQPLPMASAHELQGLTGLRQAHQKHLVASLVATQLLLPGPDPDHYQLNEFWEWSGRMKHFKQARAAWQKELHRLEAVQPALVPFPSGKAPTERSLDARAGGRAERQVPRVPKEPVLSGQPPSGPAQPEESQEDQKDQEAAALALDAETLTELQTIDAIFASLLRMVAQQGNPLKVSNPSALCRSIHRDTGIDQDVVRKFVKMPSWSGRDKSPPARVVPNSASDPMLRVDRGFLRDFELQAYPQTRELLDRLLPLTPHLPVTRTGALPRQFVVSHPRPPKHVLNSSDYKADGVYRHLAQALANTDDLLVVKKSFEDLVTFLAGYGHEASFVEQVLKGELAGVPVLFTVQAVQGAHAKGCECRFNAEHLVHFPETRKFVRNNVTKRQARATSPHPWVHRGMHASARPAPQQRVPRPASRAAPAAPKTTTEDDKGAYMQRVANLFK